MALPVVIWGRLQASFVPHGSPTAVLLWLSPSVRRAWRLGVACSPCGDGQCGARLALAAHRIRVRPVVSGEGRDDSRPSCTIPL